MSLPSEVQGSLEDQHEKEVKKMSFLPRDYSLPEKPSNYMRFEQGENKFRILSEPILGYEWWVRENGAVKQRNDKQMKGDRPVRIKMSDKMSPEVAESYKHFWAMVVWNYTLEMVQILQLTQRTIQKPLVALTKSDGWGNPVGVEGYDIVVAKTGEKLETEYQVIPQPKKKIDTGIMVMMRDMNIKLEALFEGKDPFQTNGDKLAADAVKAGV